MNRVAFVAKPLRGEYETIDLLKSNTCWLCPRDKDAFHHTSYRPERVMPVCERCHDRIHHEDGFHDELKPDIKRTPSVSDDLNVHNALQKWNRTRRSIMRTCGPGDHEFVNVCIHCDSSKARLNHLGLLCEGEDG